MNKVFVFGILFALLLLVSACGEVECPKCGGIGTIEQSVVDTVEYTVPEKYVSATRCSSCYGRGARDCSYQFTSEGLMSMTTYSCRNGYYVAIDEVGFNTGLLSGKICEHCSGRGVFNCSVCSGKGKIEVTKTRYVKKYKEVVKIIQNEDEYCHGTGKVGALDELFK